MEQILKEIDEAFAKDINTAQEVVNSAQFELNNLISVREEKKKAVVEYYTALADKERAELIIAKGEPTV